MLESHASDSAGCVHSHAKPPADERSSPSACTAVSCFLNDTVRLVLCLSIVTECPPDLQSLCLVICLIAEFNGVPKLCAVAFMLQHLAHQHPAKQARESFHSFPPQRCPAAGCLNNRLDSAQ